MARQLGDATPFPFTSKLKARSPGRLLELCQRYPARGEQHLLTGEIEKWLSSIQRADLAEVASRARTARSDGSRRLDLFLGFSKTLEYIRESRERRFTFLLVGRSGVGKSSTINMLLGEQVAEVGDDEPVTADVRSYDATVRGIPCRVVDTPGLSDGLKLDARYIAKIKSLVGRQGIDCMWFVTPLSDTRVRTDEIQTLKSLTKALGADIWRHAVVVLTFADHVPAERFAEKLESRSEALRKRIAGLSVGPGSTSGDASAVDGEAVASLPFVAVTNRMAETPDGQAWLAPLYLAALDRMSAAGFGGFFLATAPRLEVVAPSGAVTDGSSASRPRRNSRTTGSDAGKAVGRAPRARTSTPAVQTKSPVTKAIAQVSVTPSPASPASSVDRSSTSAFDSWAPAQMLPPAPPAQAAVHSSSDAQINNQNNGTQNVFVGCNIRLEQPAQLDRIVNRQMERATGLAGGLRSLGRWMVEIGKATVTGAAVAAVGKLAGKLFSVRQ